MWKVCCCTETFGPPGWIKAIAGDRWQPINSGKWDAHPGKWGPLGNLFMTWWRVSNTNTNQQQARKRFPFQGLGAQCWLSVLVPSENNSDKVYLDRATRWQAKIDIRNFEGDFFPRRRCAAYNSFALDHSFALDQSGGVYDYHYNTFLGSSWILADVVLTRHNIAD